MGYITRGVSFEEDVYFKLRELAKRYGYRSSSAFINDLCRMAIEVDEELKIVKQSLTALEKKREAVRDRILFSFLKRSLRQSASV